MDSSKILLTEEGKKKLEEEYKRLIDIERPKNIEDLSAARAQGDLKENADYDAARNNQARIEARISEIESIFRNFEIIKGKNEKVVSVGTKVIFKDLSNNKENFYFIIGTIESDPFNNKISNESPFGKAVLGHKVGDTVEIRSEKKNYMIKIIGIEK